MVRAELGHAEAMLVGDGGNDNNDDSGGYKNLDIDVKMVLVVVVVVFEWSDNDSCDSNKNLEDYQLWWFKNDGGKNIKFKILNKFTKRNCGLYCGSWWLMWIQWLSPCILFPSTSIVG